MIGLWPIKFPGDPVIYIIAGDTAAAALQAAKRIVDDSKTEQAARYGSYVSGILKRNSR